MIIIGYGANMDSKYGAPEETFLVACKQIEQAGMAIMTTSSLYKTSPVGTDENQPWYVNAVIIVTTDKAVENILATLLEIEGEVGRVRTTRNAPRVIDLDLLDYNGIIMEEPELTLPHPRMHQRGFVLYPLREIAPQWHHPETGQGLDVLISALPDEQEIEVITIS